MPKRVLRLAGEVWEAEGAALGESVAQIQQELGVAAPFPEAVERAASALAPRLPSLDRTDIPFVTIDPPSAMDLDQALHLERQGDGYLVHYAIADVAAFVAPGDPIDLEAHVRGETLYGPDSKVPLHPQALSEGAASLLPDEVRPALLWTIELDRHGERTSTSVERAQVRSTAKLSYEQVQASLEDGSVSPMLAILEDVGKLRLDLEATRGGVSLPLPSQELEADGHGQWSLTYRSPLPVELWNAQISLLTGMAAAALMVEHGVGLLRTLPPADPRDLARLRRTAKALQVSWPEGMAYPEFIRSLDLGSPAAAAVLVAATRTLRGATYVGFEGSTPDQPLHSAIAAPYAHVTAPLRRLADRYALEICVALCAGDPVPDWVLTELPTLPEVMRDSARRAGQYERALLDLAEAAVLRQHVGKTFDGVIVALDERDPREGKVVVEQPAIEAECTGSQPLPLGERVEVRLTAADVRARLVTFELA